MRLKIILRSGANLSVKVEEFSFDQSALKQGIISKLTWTGSPGADETLRFINLAEIVAILRVNEPDDKYEAENITNGR